MQISSKEMRKIILNQAYRAGVGHVGSALSVADLVAALYSGVVQTPGLERHPERDRVVLAKGHAALALYAAFYLRGWLNQAQLDTYCQDGSTLGVHPEWGQAGVDFATGSLGQGLSFGAGAALAARLLGSNRRAFVLVSDAECNEGALWEAVMFAAHHELANLVVLVDVNGQQAFGYTREVLDLAPLEERWAAFGWQAQRVDGHDRAALGQALLGLNTHEGPPHVLLAQTVLGKGVSFMEGKIKWHYAPLTEEQYRQALAEVEAACD